ncbi:protein-L-isoaspartate(D-aspartate) O-methyltransferase [Halorubellus sp. JP-L1]|uniref:protein-L-isoaspartate(D-aspartate) O-methyltransferase n=1 Tax=Halorubellus sp. JP-L1 TaxID=2715753 RepID=UPI00140E71AF|nr:protein-L-isoaspartate(D-aspartate) O-methyltransferase [Halorubellus sp. JP-L1]
MTSGFEARRGALVDRLSQRGDVTRSSTLDAMRAVRREAFVRDGDRGAAYADRPLQIGDGQTISAPHMVAIMVDALALDPGERVLEVGTGCGYHAAVTAEVVGAEHVYTVEYSERLAERARETLADLGYGDVSVRVGDGRDGWPEHAPYDAAYLTCAASELPQRVVDQVRDGGRVLAPVGDGHQRLVYAEKHDGVLDREDRGGVRFVTMRG